jgi:hypothetical protein
MIIRIKRTDTTITIASPYNADLPKRARALSGRWDAIAKFWSFPRAAEPQVKDLYLDIYGEWDDQTTDYVILRCTAKAAAETCSSLSLGGRVIARAFGRDSGARIADGVILVEGRFDSGGSVKNWRTCVEEGTVFRVLNVPRKKAEELIQYPEWCSSIEIEPPVSISTPPAPSLEGTVVGPFVRSLNLESTH